MRLAGKNLSVVAGFAFAIVALAACGSGDTADSGSSSEVTEPPVVPAVVLPVVGECWDYPKAYSRSLEGAPVDCASKHTAQTAWVGELPATMVERPFTVFEELKKKYTQADGTVDYTNMTDAEQAADDAAYEPLDSSYSDCRVAINSVVGADLQGGATMTTVFYTDISGPSIDEWAAGARWLRCNTVAKTPANDDGAESVGLMTLPEDITGVMRTPAGIQFNYCYDYKGDNFIRAVCGTPEAKNMNLAISSTIPQPGGMVWAGKKAAEKTSEKFCLSFISGYEKDSNSGTYNYWGVYEKADGSRTTGYTKNTWGTDKATFACGVSAENYKQPSP
jgi:hypothetical protein